MSRLIDVYCRALEAAILLVRETVRALSGRASEAELVMVTESEEATELEALQAQLARDHAPPHERAQP